ncbi:MAG: hypothetical protein QF464_03990 [Myxococcota bacterium]|jgi:hypothetical protein|nr:hypothetical protein [Myxococcota bacterium]
MRLNRLLLVLVVFSCLSACSDPPPCENLMSRLCAAAGPDACAKLEAHAPTDEASCQATLDDPEALNAQLDALVAATAAGALKPATPVTPTKD